MAVNKTNIKKIGNNFAKFDLSLICEGKYKDLKHTDMVIYTMLKNQESLSVASVMSGNNRYVDSNGYIFISISQKKLCKILKLSNPTLKASLDRLEKCELIESVQVGTMMCNRIYVGNAESTITLGEYITKIGIELEEEKEADKVPNIKITNKKDLTAPTDKPTKKHIKNNNDTNSISKNNKNSTGNNKKTKFHNVEHESFKDYEAKELEEKLLKNQEGKFKDIEETAKNIECGFIAHYEV